MLRAGEVISPPICTEKNMIFEEKKRGGGEDDIGENTNTCFHIFALIENFFNH